jgi:tRNA U34 2-thiouridine synthase MnmA/TrmU
MQRLGGVMTKALALFSGGLDSMLAARLVMEQGVDVTALNFISPFFGVGKKGREDEAAADFFRKYGIKSLVIDISEEYVEMIRNPRYGYGKNFNPCIDCKIFMMKKAKALMQEEGYDFIVSGEVLGQRPMSQRRDALRIIERDSGLDNYLLRPLCAKLLKPTYPEELGLIDREKLMDISGRARRRQMELAEHFGISDYETPAGGCLLTDPIISVRIEKLLKQNTEVEPEDVRLLAVGRHFTLSGGMLYVGRNSEDNRRLSGLVRAGDHTLKAVDTPGPLVLYRGTPESGNLELAARITARYSDAKAQGAVKVCIRAKGGADKTVEVKPVDEVELEPMRTIY